MLYLFESELSENKSIFFALKYIFGIGCYRSNFICKKMGFSLNLKVKNLTKDQISKLTLTIESLNYNLGNDLKKLRFVTLKKLINIKSYKGLRRNEGLPVRGQRTHTNSKTSKKKLND